MSDDLRVRVARVLAEDAPRMAWSDCLDRAIAIVWNEAIEAGRDALPGLMPDKSTQGDHARGQCFALAQAQEALRALRKREPDQ